MKNLLAKVCVPALILFGTLHAEIKTSTMEEMLDSVNLIQLGILTNTNSLVQEGTTQLRAAAKELTAIDHTKYLYFDEIKSFKYTQEKASQLSIHAVNISKSFNKNDMKTTHAEYSLLIAQCIQCHQELRDYKDKGEEYRKNLDKLPNR